ncbi:MAG: hypothetical protein JWQ59_556 [Cryobacterium sp.]|jgi:hypothetical protein|nr:hypothetical protein [Cryobacterium sp.]
MSRNSSAMPPKLNIPLIVLWLASLVVAAVGYFVLTSSNAAQAEFYNAQSVDYATYFAAQSGSGLGSTLIGVGVLGLLIALATQAYRRPAAEVVVADLEDDLFPDEDAVVAAPEPATANPVAAEPAAEPSEAAGTTPR